MYAIVAVDEDFGIGKNNMLPWKSRNDMIFFRKQTLNSVIIMGYNTFLSMECKPLPNRINIVITKKIIDNDPMFVNNTDAALVLAKSYNKDIYVIGGSSIYDQFKYDKIYITYMKGKFDCDKKFNVDLSTYTNCTVLHLYDDCTICSLDVNNLS